MEIQKLNSRPARIASRRTPTIHQQLRLREVQQLLSKRRNHLNAVTFDMLRKLGYEPLWRRIRWTGGVGSYAVMRGCILRVLVSSTKSGLTNPRTIERPYAPGIVDTLTLPGQRRGYRYGWCIEIHA